jgi:hypothetical protein
MPEYPDATTLAGQLILRVLEMRDALSRAQVPEKTQQTLFMRITRDEAWDLLKSSWGTHSYLIRFVLQVGDGFPDYREVSVPLASVAGVGMPKPGKPWVQLCGITLVWFGEQGDEPY